MFSAIDLANFIICSLKQNNKYLTSLKLQKVLYYTVVAYYKIEERMLISDDIEKWRFGPVVPSVYHTFKSYGYMSSTSPATRYEWTSQGYRASDHFYATELDSIPFLQDIVSAVKSLKHLHNNLLLPKC